MGIRFEWDPGKAAANRQKHRVSFEEACTVLADPSILTINDESHSDAEDRWASMGITMAGRVVVVIHTWPEAGESGDEVVRIISARRANKREQAMYMERKP